VNLLRLAWKSLLNRRGTALLTIMTIAVSVALLLGVEKVRLHARESFANTVSGTDLIVGARSGSVQLLLYSVFRIGNATNNISWGTYQEMAALPGVRWSIPISLGDSHRGYRVVGTTSDYFEHFRYANKRRLEFASGRAFEDTLEAVLGAEVARQLGYRSGDSLVVAHGVGAEGLLPQHTDYPFTVSGILAPTGTPVDRSVHVSLAGIEAIHLNWNKLETDPVNVRGGDLEPRAITAFMLGLENRILAFSLQRRINEYPGEPLLAIFPGVALQELWDLMRVAEQALQIVSVLVAAAAMTGLLTVSLAGLNERRREMAILRSVGAGYRHVMGLLISEAALLTALGIGLGLVLQNVILLALQSWLVDRFGLYLPPGPPGAREWALLGGLQLAGIVVGLLPAWRAYRNSLADGLSTRL
jgi:putative ABC transport system permease protein